MKKITVALLVLVAMLSAAFVDQNAAQKAAENYYKNYAPISEKGNVVTNIFAHEYEGQVTWYGVSFDKGFVLITADDGLKPILGYSFDGKLVDPSKRDGGAAFKEWFGYMDKQVLVARKYNYVDAAAQTEWKNINNNLFSKASKSIVVDALVKSKWDQVWPWNDLCPDKSIGTWTYTGCVATAASMIMRYHEWPPTGTGTNSYSWDGQTLSETFSNYTFDYTVMKHEPQITYGLYPTYWEDIDMDAAAIQNMAELNYLTGQSFDMSYGDTADGGSGAIMSTASTAMNNYWYYTSTLTNVGTPVDPALGAAAIQAELNAKRPWWWAGGVHSFILDGYTDDYWYHFNWGWGGSQDGWFQITFLVPDGVGSGGGDGDYTAGQIRISLVPDTDTFAANWPAPTGFGGNLVNNEDVQLSWNAASGAQSYDVFKNAGMGAFVKLANTTSTSYNDNGLSVGLYSYFVRAIYSDGESHNTSSYSVEVASLPGFSSIRAFSAASVGRTNIDLTWDVPFTGVIFFDEDFEAGLVGWTQKQSVALGVKPPSRDYFLESLDGWQLIDEAFFGDPQYIHSGLQSTGLGYTAGTAGNGAWSWNFTPEFTIPAGGGFISFWIWYKNNEAEGWYTNIRAYMYQGDFTEQSVAEAEANVSNIFTWEGAVLGEAGNNLYDSEVYIDLGAYAGTYRFAWVYEYTDGYQLCVDDLLCGTTVGGTDLPDEYDIYRNGSLATTVPYTGNSELWADTGFADGLNSYFVKAIYPTGSSLASGTRSVTIDANPKPDYLTGVLNGADVELAWYMPYGTPSHWAAYITPENCTTTIDVLTDTDCAKRRVQFAAADLGLYYPVTIDSIAAGFYEWSDDLWGTNNTFVIRLWDGVPVVGGTPLWESGTLTATAGEVYKVGLPTPVVMNSYWNVEVEVFDLATGHPANLAGPSASGGTHSYFYYTAEASYSYYISSGDAALEYCMMSYVTGADPDPIVKAAAPGEKVDKPVVGWSTSEKVLEGTPMIDKSGRLIEKTVASSKGVDTYNIYRDGGYIGSTTSLTYTDAPANAGDYDYYVTTAYVSPVGESAASNEITVLNVPGTGGQVIPAVPANVVTSIAGANLVIDWSVSADATGYDVYSSNDPYGTFAYAATVGTNQYTVAASQAKLFYQIIATNATKVAPKTIEVSKQVK